MLKKTLIAASLAAATSTAFAGEISVSGTAYKVGTEYLGAYTGSALSGDLETGSIGIQYRPGIALGVNNTLKFEFAGGAIAADTGLELFVINNAAAHGDDAAVQAAIDAAVGAVVATGTQATDLAALKAAAIGVINAESAATNAAAAVAAVNAVVWNTDFATTAGDIQALNTIVIGTVGASVADLVDFGTDANNDYEWVLFKLTAATAADAVIVFNDTDGDHAANVVTKFTKSTIGAGDLTVSLPEAKDDTGTVLSAPVAGAKTLVTTAAQFAVTATAVSDTIDVEQDRLYFVDVAAAQDTTGTFTFDVTNDLTIDLGIDAATADVEFEISGSLAGVDSVDLVDSAAIAADDSAAFDADNLVAGTGIEDATITVTVDGETNLATRTLGLTVMVTPAEADTEAFYILGAANSASNAFVWDLNGSEITFPYAPIGYDHITTNFELANSGDQQGDVLITAFTREGVDYSGTLAGKAVKESLTKIGENEIYEALGLTAGTSLSITFSTTAPDADIKITGYSNIADKGGRMTLLSTAYEGEKANCSGTIAAGAGTITCN